MISLAAFFDLNKEIILFIYGLVFFILGLAISLQVRQSSRLDLARSLRWLAAFGILHAFTDWGDLFLPIQANYLNPTAIKLLEIVQLLLLAGSFSCLFEFGIALLRPLGRARWLHGFPAGLMLIWVLVIFFVILPFQTDAASWYRTANALARYLIGFPGGILAAYALREHTFTRIAQLNVPRIVNTLRIAGIGLGIYAILAGLIPPPVDFFPGNLVNSQSFMQSIGIPVIVFRSTIGLIIVVAFIRALEIFDLETQRRIESLEQQHIINAEHERLARELHDGAIQKVYTAGLLVEAAARLAKPKSAIGSRLDRAVLVLNDSIADLRRNLRDLHTQSTISDVPLPQLFQQQAKDPHYNSLVNISLELKLAEDNALSPMRTDHVFAIINEALSNIVRHAHARNVKIQAQDQGKTLQVVIRDDGIGLSPNAQPGYGLRNMRDRARLLNGMLDFSSPNSKGTTVTLEIPWVDA
jgi:signal transduction histidine kinase